MTDRLIGSHSDQAARPLVHTTREPAEGEVDGLDHRFITAEQFNMMRDGDEFVCHDQKSGHAKKSVQAVVAEGKVPILDVSQDVLSPRYPKRNRRRANK